MNFNLDDCFRISDELETCLTQSLSPEDRQRLSTTLKDCVSHNWEEFAIFHFNLPEGEVENIKMDHQNNRELMIWHIVNKWYENRGQEATLENVLQILDYTRLLGLKQIWLCSYQGETLKDFFNKFKTEHEEFLKKVACSSITDGQWEEFEIKLPGNTIKKHHHETDSVPSIRRYKSLSRWTERNGYLEATKASIIEALKSAKLYDVIREVTGESCGETITAGSGDNDSSFTYHIGLLSDSEDEQIAKRLENKIKNLGYRVSKIANYVSQEGAGIPVVEKPVHLSDECVCVLWIATPASVKSKGYDKHCRDSAQFNSIDKERERGVTNFVVLLPQDNLNLKLPRSMGAYDPLREDDKFEECLEHTFNRMKKKRKKLSC